MNDTLRRLKGLIIAIVALALSASLTFGAQAPASGFALGSSYEDSQNGDEVSGDEDANEEEDTDEATEESSSESADNCLTDPTTLTEEELAAMTHGSIVCWAAQQETPEGYANHGAFVREWAHFGKDGGGGGGASATAKTKGQGKGLANRP